VRSQRAVLVVCAVAALAASVQCGGSPASPSITPTPITTPTPTPTPTATPDPNVPPAGLDCGEPYPPPVTRFSVAIHQKDVGFWQIDSTPLVGPDVDYCWTIGFTDGRSICPVRVEGAPDREACELWRTGKAKDTGKYGPTWTFIGKDGTESGCSSAPDAPCQHYEDDGHYFQVKAIKGGLYRACSEAGACGQVDVDRLL
jgi:hypothetical protein